MAPLFGSQIQAITKLLVQLDAVDVVFFEKVFLPAVRLVMMRPAQRNRVQSNMDDLLTVAPHADPVYMVHLCGLIADGAAAVCKAEIQLLADVIGLVEQAFLGRHRPVEAELNQIVDEVFGCGHVGI